MQYYDGDCRYLHIRPHAMEVLIMNSFLKFLLMMLKSKHCYKIILKKMLQLGPREKIGVKDNPHYIK